MKNLKRNNDFIFGLKLLCAFLIFAGYMLIVLVLPLLLITALPILALINILIVAAGIILEILRLVEKPMFRIISDICIFTSLIYFVIVVCRIFI